jgi:hypothetical protein
VFHKHTFEVSYRSFLPKGVDNLLLTGASLSFTYETIFMVMRNFPWCTQTGEIAGSPPPGALPRGSSRRSWSSRRPTSEPLKRGQPPGPQR